MKRSDSPATSSDGDVEDGPQQRPSGEDTDEVVDEANDDPTGKYCYCYCAPPLLVSCMFLWHPG